MVRIGGKKLRYHFEGVHGKVSQIRELVDVLDQMFESFHRINHLSRSMLGSSHPEQQIQPPKGIGKRKIR